MLALLLSLRRVISGRTVWPGWQGRGAGVVGLVVYLFGFSWAYLSLDAGVGALILFGAVQITMFAGAVLAREAVPGTRWAGSALAFGGLLVLVAPGAGDAPAAPGALSMGLAGVGWGIYSLAGRKAVDALGATGWNFLFAVPVAALVVLALGGVQGPLTGWGVALAVASGAMTSGLGYALWYAIVPGLGAARAGVAQLTVPVMAAAGGAAALGEGVGLRFVVASALVLGGVALASRQSALARR
jgi:drug/metabolite transporter (DMT)-like permease